MAAAGHSGAAPAALAALSTFLDGSSIDTLRRPLGLTHSAAVRLTDRLAEDGLVRREPGVDGRSVSIRLTDEGAAVAERIRRDRQAALAAVLDPLSAGRTRGTDRPAGEAARRGDGRPGRRRPRLPALRRRGLRSRRRALPGDTSCRPRRAQPPPAQPERADAAHPRSFAARTTNGGERRWRRGTRARAGTVRSPRATARCGSARRRLRGAVLVPVALRGGRRHQPGGADRRGACGLLVHGPVRRARPRGPRRRERGDRRHRPHRQGRRRLWDNASSCARARECRESPPRSSQIADAAKKGCPVSKALAAVDSIELDAQLA